MLAEFGAPFGAAAFSACPGLPEDLHELAESFGRAIDAKDAFTADHSDEVAEFGRAIALEMGLDQEFAGVVHLAGHLHDIGKIGVPDSILGKPAGLSREELALIRKHPEIGALILSPVRALCERGVPELVLSHHERFDGGGYPFGLRGEAIALGARILSVADAVSAMLQHRPYRAALSLPEVFTELARGRGLHFDPWAVDAALALRIQIAKLVKPVEIMPDRALTG